jgi:hypothetical protein
MIQIRDAHNVKTVADFLFTYPMLFESLRGSHSSDFSQLPTIDQDCSGSRVSLPTGQSANEMVIRASNFQTPLWQ